MDVSWLVNTVNNCVQCKPLLNVRLSSCVHHHLINYFALREEMDDEENTDYITMSGYCAEHVQCSRPPQLALDDEKHQPCTTQTCKRIVKKFDTEDKAHDYFYPMMRTVLRFTRIRRLDGNLNMDQSDCWLQFIDKFGDTARRGWGDSVRSLWLVGSHALRLSRALNDRYGAQLATLVSLDCQMLDGTGWYVDLPALRRLRLLGATAGAILVFLLHSVQMSHPERLVELRVDLHGDFPYRGERVLEVFGSTAVRVARVHGRIQHKSQMQL